MKLNHGEKFRSGIIDHGLVEEAVFCVTESPSHGALLGSLSVMRQNFRPIIDLVLAVPRPLRLERLLPIISCMGVGKLILIGAAKVEKDYFGKSNS